MLRIVAGLSEWLARLFIVLAAVTAAAHWGTDGFSHRAAVPSSAIQPWAGGGHAYTFNADAALGARSALALWLHPSDDGANPRASSLALYDSGGKRFGQPHSLHAEIGAKGEGRYSDWNGWVIFSLPDNGDPRLGAQIVVERKASWLRVLAPPLLLGALLLLLRLIIPVRPQMKELMWVMASFNALRAPWLGKAVDAVLLLALCAMPVYLFRQYGAGRLDWGDAENYIAAARQFLEGGALRSVPDLTQPLPLTLIRLPGYSLFLAAIMAVAGDFWWQIVLGLQIGVAVAAGYVVYVTLIALSGFRLVGLIGALVWMASQRSVFDSWIITDSLYTSILTVISCRLIWRAWTQTQPTRREILWCAAGFAITCSFREFTLLIFGAYLPLLLLAFWHGGPVWPALRRIGAMIAPSILLLFAVLVWNHARSGYAVLSTGSADAPLYRMLELQMSGAPVFTRDEPLDVAVREELARYGFGKVYIQKFILGNVMEKTGLRAPDLAKIVARRYFETWREQPGAMLAIALRDLNAVRSILEPLGFVDRKTGSYAFSANAKQFQNLLTLCVAVLPLLWLVAALALRKLRRKAGIVLSIIPYVAAPTTVYLVIHFEVRYALYAVAPLLAIPAMTVGALAAPVRSWLKRRMESGGPQGRAV